MTSRSSSPGPTRRRGRGSATTPTPVKAAAARLGIEVDRRRVGTSPRSRVELAVVVAYGAIVPAGVLDVVPMLNLHFSLLPRWRGAAPIERAILAGDERTGVCVMGLEPTLDTGPIYARAEVDVDDKDLAGAARRARRARRRTSSSGCSRAGLAGLPGPEPQLGESDLRDEADRRRARARLHPSRRVEVARVVRLGRARTVARRAAPRCVRRAEVVDARRGGARRAPRRRRDLRAVAGCGCSRSSPRAVARWTPARGVGGCATARRRTSVVARTRRLGRWLGSLQAQRARCRSPRPSSRRTSPTSPARCAGWTRRPTVSTSTSWTATSSPTSPSAPPSWPRSGAARRATSSATSC